MRFKNWKNGVVFSLVGCSMAVGASVPSDPLGAEPMMAMGASAPAVIEKSSGVHLPRSLSTPDQNVAAWTFVVAFENSVPIQVEATAPTVDRPDQRLVLVVGADLPARVVMMEWHYGDPAIWVRTGTRRANASDKATTMTLSTPAVRCDWSALNRCRVNVGDGFVTIARMPSSF